MKLSSICIATMLVLMVLAFVLFGYALHLCSISGMHFGWAVVPPTVLSIVAMICLNAAEHFAARGQ